MTTPEVNGLGERTDRCNACGNTPENHDGMRHPFTPKGGSTSWLKPQKTAVESRPSNVGGVRIPQSKLLGGQPSIPFDPVLRVALMNKGVITPDDLEAAEKVIRALGMGGALDGPAEPQESAPGV